MNDPTARALHLLSLLQTHRFWSGAELVEELGVSARTVRRDVDRLRELGYPVDATTGVTGGYRLARGAALPPLVFDDEEAVAMAVGLRAAAAEAIAGIEATSLRALAKLEQVLPDRLRRRVNAVATTTSTIGWATPPAVIDPNALALLAQGCRDREEVRFAYVSRDDVASDRLVEPHQLVSRERRWYLVAYDVRRADWRTFRLDRLNSVALAGRRFERRPPPAASYEAFVDRSVRLPRELFEGSVVVSCAHAAIEEYCFHSGATFTALATDRFRVALQSDSFEWLVGLLAILATLGEITVEGSPDLQHASRLIAGRLDAAS
jgi:predicted DNA-binding transcriptional regulator YafY